MVAVAGTHVWFSPFGLNTHATMQAMATMIRPMIRLALLVYVSIMGIAGSFHSLTTYPDAIIILCVFLLFLFVQLFFSCTAQMDMNPCSKLKVKFQAQEIRSVLGPAQIFQTKPPRYPFYASERECLLRPSANAVDLANPG